jgi:ABC-type transport system substrate-binding protein
MRSIRALERSLVAAATALLALGGCRGPLDAPLGAAHPDDATPRRGGVLHLATLADVTSLDPVTSNDSFNQSVIRLVYAGLVDYDADGHVAPDLAASVAEADGGSTYRFTLREGARFHDGTEVTAQEVQRSIERALHPSSPASTASLFESIAGFADYTSNKAPHLAGVVVEGRYVVAIHLREPSPTFLSLLALPLLRVTCPSAGDRYAPAWAPCGAGPFKIAAGGWEHGRTLSLVRHDDYFRPGLPYLDGVTWELTQPQIAQSYKFARGDQDALSDLSQPDTVRYQTDARWQPFGAYEPFAQSVSGEAMNVEIAPFDNVEIRRAVAAAIDRDHIALLRASNLAPMTRPVPPMPGYDTPPIGQSHDLAAALDHMRKAGYPFDPATGTGGWPAVVPYDTYRPGLAEATAQLVQQDLATIGVRVELHVSSFPTWSAITHRRGKSALSPQGWTEDYPDPENFLEPRFASSSIADGDGSNYSFYSSPRVDGLLARAKHEADHAARNQLFAEVERILCDEAPWAFEYSYRGYQVRQPYVRGYRPHAIWATDVVPMWLDRRADTLARARAPFSRQLVGSLAGEPR